MSELVTLGSQAVFLIAVAALAQSITGFGFAVAGVPLLTLVIAPDLAVVAVTALGVVVTGGAWRQEREHVDSPSLRQLLLAGCVGIPFGLLLLMFVPAPALLLVIAAAVLITAVMVGTRVQYRPSSRGHWMLGISSGALLASTGINGPPLVVSLSARQLTARPFRATLQSIFCMQEAVVVVAFLVLGLVTREVVTVIAGGLLGAPLGWWLGNRVFVKLSAHVFHRVVTFGLVAAGVAAALSALG